jgi:hypothetical protein
MTTTMEAVAVQEERIQARMRELQREYERGEQQLRDLVRQEAALRETLLRISGAMQVLRELMVGDSQEPAAGPESAGEPESAPTVLTVP